MSCRHSWLLVNSGTVSAVMTAKVNKQATDLCFRPGSETLLLYMARRTRHLSFHFLYRLHRHVYAHIFLLINFQRKWAQQRADFLPMGFWEKTCRGWPLAFSVPCNSWNLSHNPRKLSMMNYSTNCFATASINSMDDVMLWNTDDWGFK